MKTRANRSSHFGLVSSTLGTTLVSILAAWVVNSFVFAPVLAAPEAAPQFPAITSINCRSFPLGLTRPPNPGEFR
jgi:hypothetical protein